jgi:hypothetical protein
VEKIGQGAAKKMETLFPRLADQSYLLSDGAIPGCTVGRMSRRTGG